MQWVQKKENRRKTKIIGFIPIAALFGPNLEEVSFRLPIILLFTELSQNAWYAIFISSFFFGLIHFWNKKTSINDLIKARKEKTHKSGKVNKEIKRLENEARKKNQLAYYSKKIAHVISATMMGIFLGYLAIKSQSILLVIALHGLWNLILGPIFVVSAVIIIGLIALILISIIKLFKSIFYIPQKFLFKNKK